MGKRRNEMKMDEAVAVTKRNLSARNCTKEEGSSASLEGENKAAGSTEENISGSRVVHPLLIDHVLDKIFQYAFSSAMSEGGKCAVYFSGRQFRLVCRVWSERATIAFADFRPPVEIKCSDEMKKLLNTIRSGKMIHIQKYAINENVYSLENKVLMEEFLEICGPGTVALHLVGISKFKSLCFRPQPSTAEFKLEKLKTLKIECENFISSVVEYPHHESWCMPDLIQHILRAAPKLEEFAITAEQLECDERLLAGRFLENMFSALPNTLKTLKLAVGFLFNSEMKSLTEKKLKLEILELNVKTDSCSDETIYDFFSGQSDTLKSLDLRGLYFRALPIPQLQKLLYLKVVPHYCSGNLIPLNFNEAFSNLSSLNLESAQVAAMDLLKCNDKFLSLVELTLPNERNVEIVVRRAADLFPNLKRLHFSQWEEERETIEAILTHLLNIEELSVTFRAKYFTNCLCLSGDHIFGGVPQSDCQLALDEDAKLDELLIQPTIINLTRLRRLKLYGMKDIPQIYVRFTEFLAGLLLKMDSLEEIHADQSFKMSPESMQRLRSKVRILGLHSGA